MAELEMFVDRLAMDISKDLERIEGIMFQVINDRNTTEEFKRDPNGVLVRLGLHPPTTADVNERVNRVFYACLTNKELIQYLTTHYETFKPSRMVEYQEFYIQGLKEGKLQNKLEYDLLAADHLLKQPEPLREVLKLTLYDLNKKRILVNTYTKEELDGFISRLVPAIIERKPILEHPKLEQWDRNYGVGGFFYGTEAVEVGPVVTVVTLAEGVVLITIAGIAAQTPTERLMVQAALGDDASVKMFATMAKVMSFGADLMAYAHHFERR